jgi:rubrerythrin
MMTAPNESMRRMLRNAIAREREEMRMIRELMMGGPMDP